MNSPGLILRLLCLGCVAGVIISIVPLELGVLLVPGLLVLWIVAVRRRPSGVGLSSYVIQAIAALVTVTVAILLPVKQLDRKVGPIRFERMSLDSLCQALSTDYRVFVRAPYPQGTNMFFEFHTERAMTRREVLQRLAKNSDCDLRIGYCGNGSSFLFGSLPGFTRLDLKVAKPDRTANPGQGAAGPTGINLSLPVQIQLPPRWFGPQVNPYGYSGDLIDTHYQIPKPAEEL